MRTQSKVTLLLTRFKAHMIEIKLELQGSQFGKPEHMALQVQGMTKYVREQVLCLEPDSKLAKLLEDMHNNYNGINTLFTLIGQVNCDIVCLADILKERAENDA